LGRAAGPLVAALLCVGFHAGCGTEGRPDPPGENRTIAPIDDVLNEHAPLLMKIDGVVGVYAGELEDGTPCLVVMLRDEGPERKGQIPAVIGGYPVRLEIGGEIRPLGK
jgi:hypothetical protein